MATIKTAYTNGQVPMPIPTDQADITVYTEVALLAAQIDAGLVIQLCVLPAGCLPVGYKFNTEDLDSGTPALTVDFGILTAAGTAISTDAADGGDEWLDGSTMLQSAAIVQHTASVATYERLRAVTKTDTDRIVALVVAIDAATAEAGTVGFEFTYHQG